MGKITDTRPRDGGYLLSDHGSISTDTATFASGHAFQPGELLGQVTATKKFKAWTPAATDGTEDVAAICYGHVEASAADAEGAITARLAEVDRQKLILPAGATLADAEAGLASKLIVFRN